LLDTNILIHYVRGDELWEAIRADYQLLLIEPKPIISIVNAAELRSLALQFQWGPAKLDKMEFLLGYLDEMFIDSREMVDAYSTIDAHLSKVGHKIGKNDLWIAATAYLNDATLLTTDRDFDPLDPLFLKREWIPPTGEFAAD